MTKTAGRPKQKPQRVTVTLEPHHAAELQLMADEAGVKLSAFCAHVLERYSLQDRQVMTGDILKLAFEQQTQLMQQNIRVALNEQMNRVRSLLARTSLESGSTKQMVGLLVKDTFGKDKGPEYIERAWNFAVHQLKEPTPQIRAALSELAAGMGNDDPGLLLKVRESSEQMTAGLKDVQALTAQVQALQQQQQQLVNYLGTLNQQVKAAQEAMTMATRRLENTEDELRNKPKGFFNR
ncbi:hypothetical protein [Deinococcus humi]|uniref:Outer membrane murein-binding lipoprotein Lpp n=1 Tax=Deinococcus humi TaxID=662880 RepID=A0A7W8K071_9DEIO|nr:hypothetical protein [Deinococcus humi]MBB5366447.1 outer membrane murein-binding lipoprotein Lpp [Deinococcus humi]